jgi:hypothetical protein
VQTFQPPANNVWGRIPRAYRLTEDEVQQALLSIQYANTIGENTRTSKCTERSGVAHCHTSIDCQKGVRMLLLLRCTFGKACAFPTPLPLLVAGRIDLRSWRLRGGRESGENTWEKYHHAATPTAAVAATATCVCNLLRVRITSAAFHVPARVMAGANPDAYSRSNAKVAAFRAQEQRVESTHPCNNLQISPFPHRTKHPPGTLLLT